MTRYEKLSLYLQACAATPFGWGKHDCCTFISGAVLVQVGRDPMEDLPLYADEFGAAAIIAANGGIEAMATQRLGSSVPTTSAQRGDVVLFDVGPYGPALGICIGAKFAAANPEGLGFYAMRHARLAWRIA